MRYQAPESDAVGCASQASVQTTRRLDGHLIWNISAVSSCVFRMADILGRRVGVTGSQWLLLEAVSFSAQNDGVSIGEVAALLNVKASFVSSQTKALEGRGFVHRRQSGKDRRVFLLSLTEDAAAKLTGMNVGLFGIERLLRGELDEHSILETSTRLDGMRRRLARAIARAEDH